MHATSPTPFPMQAIGAAAPGGGHHRRTARMVGIARSVRHSERASSPPRRAWTSFEGASPAATGLAKDQRRAGGRAEAREH
ncbi:unnamed protein product [Lampetra planeri]